MIKEDDFVSIKFGDAPIDIHTKRAAKEFKVPESEVTQKNASICENAQLFMALLKSSKR